MGKKRFIDPKKDVVHTVVLSSKKMPGLPGILGPRPEASKKAKPGKVKQFQLRCDIATEDAQSDDVLPGDSISTVALATRGSVRFSEDFPALGEKPLPSKSFSKSKAPPGLENGSFIESVEPAGTSVWQTSLPSTSAQCYPEENMHSEQNDECYKYSSYGIYFDDDYNYEQHLRDPNDWPLADADTELFQIPKEHPQAHKKSGPKKLASIPETFSYEAPPNDGITSNFQAAAEANPEPYDELFDDADEEEIPDDFINLLDAEDCGDYSDEDNEAMDSDGFMDVSDDEECNTSSNDEKAQMLSLAVHNTATELPESVPHHDDDCAEVEEDMKTRNDSFFDRVPGMDDDEEPQRQIDMPTLQSSRGAKPVTAEYERFNAKFDALLLRDYQNEDVGDARLDEVDGYLPDDASQVSKFTQDLRPIKYRDERVALVGPEKEEETNEDLQMRLKALQYCKTYKESKPKSFEVCVPDPRAMQYNVNNLPTVRNKNKPIIIKNELPFLNRRKKNGLSVKDLKQHDAQLNTPHRDVDEEAQTYKTMATELSYRPPDETTEEHRQRKNAVKALRRARREEKKQNSVAQRDMILNTTKVNMNAKHCKGIPLL